MRNAARSLPLAIAAAWYELLMLLPLWWLVQHYDVPSRIGIGWAAAAIPALSAVGAAIGLLLRVVWQQSLAVIAATVLTGWVAVAAAGTDGAGAAIAAAAGAASLLQGATIARRAGRAGWFWFGVAVHFGASAVYAMAPAWQPLLPNVAPTGIAVLIVAAFATNRLHLIGAAQAERNPGAVPGAIRRHNRLFVGALLLLAGLLALGLGGVLANALWRLTRAAIGALLSLFGSSGEPEEPAPEPEPTPAPPPIAPEEPNRWAEWLNWIGYIAGGLIAAAVVVFALVWLYRNGGGLIQSLLRKLAGWLKLRNRGEVADAYQDEEKSVFSWEETLRRLKDNRLGKLLFRPREESWEQMADNRQRARYLYRSWLRGLVGRGYRVERHLTPLETARDAEQWSAGGTAQSGRGSERGGRSRAAVSPPDGLLQLYYKARYSAQDITDAELSRVAAEAKRGRDGG